MEYLKDLFRRIMADLVKAHKSWTMWFNVVCVPALVMVWPQLMEALPSVTAILPGDKAAQITALVAVVNAILRFKTNGALADK